MKKILFYIAFYFCSSFIGMTEANAQLIVIKIPEPPRVIITQPSTPKDGHDWVNGYWYVDSKSNQYAWKDGHWKKQNPGHYWSDGKWEACNGGHRWVGGKWVKGTKHSHHDNGHGKSDHHDNGKGKSKGKRK